MRLAKFWKFAGGRLDTQRATGFAQLPTHAHHWEHTQHSTTNAQTCTCERAHTQTRARTRCIPCTDSGLNCFAWRSHDAASCSWLWAVREVPGHDGGRAGGPQGVAAEAEVPGRPLLSCFLLSTLCAGGGVASWDAPPRGAWEALRISSRVDELPSCRSEIQGMIDYQSPWETVTSQASKYTGNSELQGNCLKTPPEFSDFHNQLLRQGNLQPFLVSRAICSCFAPPTNTCCVLRGASIALLKLTHAFRLLLRHQPSSQHHTRNPQTHQNRLANETRLLRPYLQMISTRVWGGLVHLRGAKKRA